VEQRSARLPVTEKVAGSNPVSPAKKLKLAKIVLLWYYFFMPFRTETAHNLVQSDSYVGSPHIANLVVNAEEERLKFANRMQDLKPQMAELADIEEQVLRIPDAANLRPSDTLPLPEVIRPYTTAEEQLIRRGLRVNIAEKDANFIFSPLVTAKDQKELASGYAQYVKGRKSLSSLRRQLVENVPAFIATLAVAHNQHSEDMLSMSYNYTAAANPKLVAEAMYAQPELVSEWMRYGDLFVERRFRAHGIFRIDPTNNIGPRFGKTIYGATISDVLRELDVEEAVQTYGDDIDRLRRYNDHTEKMAALREEGYHFEVQGKSKRFDYFNGVANWSSYDENRAIRDKAEDIPEEAAFKFHLMPQVQDIPDTTRTLLEALKTDKSFGNAIQAFKVTNTPKTDAKLGEHPTPEIVIYPCNRVEDVVQALTTLRKLFSSQPGRNKTPRFNVPVDQSTMLYMAQGHGHEKLDAYNNGDEQLSEVYDQTQNYAFRKDQAPLIGELFKRSDELLKQK
jgi:hypothetical protein